MTLTKEQALHCLNAFEHYFGNFDRIDQYMRDQKLNSLAGMSSNPLFPIEDDLFPELFEAFKKGKNGVSGLGLSIVKRVCGNCGAEINAANLSDGVEFRVEFKKM